jgi:hypothetical protein
LHLPQAPEYVLIEFHEVDSQFWVTWQAAGDSVEHSSEQIEAVKQSRLVVEDGKHALSKATQSTSVLRGGGFAQIELQLAGLEGVEEEKWSQPWHVGLEALEEVDELSASGFAVVHHQVRRQDEHDRDNGELLLFGELHQLERALGVVWDKHKWVFKVLDDELVELAELAGRSNFHELFLDDSFEVEQQALYHGHLPTLPAGEGTQEGSWLE